MLQAFDSLAAIDELAVGRSRAALLRAAVHEYLARRREEQVEDQLARGLRRRAAGGEELGTASASARGLAASNLDW